MNWLRQSGEDARLALRMLQRAPGFTLTIILTLALGIGMTSAVFSVFNAVLLRPLAYPDPERLMWVSTYDPDAPFPMETVLGPDFLAWKDQASSFEHLVAYDLSDAALIIDANATQERVARVSEGFWELTGPALALGRVPEPGERDVPGRFTVVIRASIDPVALAPAVTKAVADIDRTLPVFDVQTLEQALADSIAPRRLNLFLLGVFAAAALGLSLVGIYGVIAYSVTQRTHEIGIRIALGADRRDVVTMVARQGLGLALAGVVIGTAAATLLTRVMASMLYDVRPTDPQTFAIAAVGLTLTALMASLVPAVGAARIDPVETLR